MISLDNIVKLPPDTICARIPIHIGTICNCRCEFCYFKRNLKTARHIAGAKPGIGSVTRTNQFRACIYWEIILFLNKMISSFYERRFTADRLVGGKKCIDFVF